jgi:hypothetical protein
LAPNVSLSLGRKRISNLPPARLAVRMVSVRDDVGAEGVLSLRFRLLIGVD